MEIKFKQLLFTAEKRTIRCNLEITKFWIEDYTAFPKLYVSYKGYFCRNFLFCFVGKLLKSSY